MKDHHEQYREPDDHEGICTTGRAELPRRIAFETAGFSPRLHRHRLALLRLPSSDIGEGKRTGDAIRAEFFRCGDIHLRLGSEDDGHLSIILGWIPELTRISDQPVE